MKAAAPPVARFRLGHIVTTPNALSKLSQDDILTGIRRHQAGDWGEGDAGANERALLDGARLWSIYRSASGLKFWLITEAGRQTTTILLPEDY